MVSEHDCYWREVGIGMALALAVMLAITLVLYGVAFLVGDVFEA